VSLTWFSAVIDCRDPEALAAFWWQVLGYQVVLADPEGNEFCVLAHQTGW
jgi:hypothetical protein